MNSRWLNPNFYHMNEKSLENEFQLLCSPLDSHKHTLYVYLHEFANLIRIQRTYQ